MRLNVCFACVQRFGPVPLSLSLCIKGSGDKNPEQIHPSPVSSWQRIQWRGAMHGRRTWSIPGLPACCLRACVLHLGLRGSLQEQVSSGEREREHVAKGVELDLHLGLGGECVERESHGSTIMTTAIAGEQLHTDLG